MRTLREMEAAEEEVADDTGDDQVDVVSYISSDGGGGDTNLSNQSSNSDD